MSAAFLKHARLTINKTTAGVQAGPNFNAKMI
jgi:hypothetical protein